MAPSNFCIVSRDDTSQRHTVAKSSGRSSTVAFMICCTVVGVFTIARNHESTKSEDHKQDLAANAMSAALQKDDAVKGGKALIQTTGALKARKDGHIIWHSHQRGKHELSAEELDKMNVDKRQVVSERQIIDKEDDTTRKAKRVLDQEKRWLNKEERDIRDEKRLLKKGSLRKARKLADADRGKLSADIEKRSEEFQKIMAEESTLDAGEARVAKEWDRIQTLHVSKEMQGKHQKEEKRHDQILARVANLEDRWKAMESKRKELSEYLSNEKQLGDAGAI